MWMKGEGKRFRGRTFIYSDDPFVVCCRQHCTCCIPLAQTHKSVWQYGIYVGEKAREWMGGGGMWRKTYIYRADPCSALPKLAGTLSSPLFDHFAFRIVIDPPSFAGGFDPPYPDGTVTSAGG